VNRVGTTSGPKEQRMTLTISGRHNTLTPALRQYAESKASKLAKYLDLVESVSVVVDVCRKGRKKECRVEMRAMARHKGQFVASLVGDAYGAVDGCFHKLERLLSEAKQKLKNPKHLVAARRLRVA
jgi:putative sigma-54 modulation protein